MAVEAGAASPAAPSKRAAGGKKPATSIGRVRLRLTLFLALLLCLLGLAGAEGASLLQRAIRIPTADDIAQRVCTAYQRQDYDLLAQTVDPAATPPEVPGPFDAAAKADLTGQLKALDAQAGPVAACSYKAVAFDVQGQGQTQATDHRQYIFTMTRGHGQSVAYTTLMTLVRQRDGSWLVSRTSNFVGGPGGAG